MFTASFVSESWLLIAVAIADPFANCLTTLGLLCEISD